LEAMKMENEIVATKDGTVTVVVSEGAKINSGDAIAYIA
ncbi:MAG: acetyl-CoA carboxylase biotin carboxyl carrier protein subunit, partial [Clostridia bacterium]|nr:acetyl-CoA carboxylase biotin carboxyl carrier protein subunit [Clostridia bacterium]